jgi:broad specificity phosphatase PhoE
MIYFIRHGESEANLRHVFAGQKDNSALTDKGREQARLEGEKIKSLNLSISKIISSPLIRAHDTAKIVAGIIGLIIVLFAFIVISVLGKTLGISGWVNLVK